MKNVQLQFKTDVAYSILDELRNHPEHIQLYDRINIALDDSIALGRKFIRVRLQEAPFKTVLNALQSAVDHTQQVPLLKHLQEANRRCLSLLNARRIDEMSEVIDPTVAAQLPPPVSVPPAEVYCISTHYDCAS
jgi:hypothetical protein